MSWLPNTGADLQRRRSARPGGSLLQNPTTQNPMTQTSMTQTSMTQTSMTQALILTVVSGASSPVSFVQCRAANR